MEDRRCPDCGYRLKNNECPICFKRVPLLATNKKEKNQSVPYTQPQQIEVKKTEESAQVSANGWVTKKKTKKIKVIPSAIIAVVVALMTLFTNVMDEVNILDSGAESDYYEDYIPAGEGEAAEVPQIEPQQVYDQDGLSIRVDGMGLLYGEYAIMVTVTNDADCDLEIQSNEISVNGYMMPGLGLYCTAESGKEIQTFLRLDKYDLEEAGITEIAEVAFWMNVFESENFTKIATTELITLQTSIAEGFVQPVDDSGMEIYVADDIRFKVKDVELSDYDYGYVTVFAENCSDSVVILADGGIWLNGEETYAMLWTAMRPHTRVIERIYFDDLQELGIDKKEQMETVTIQMSIWYEENATNPRQVLDSVSQTVEIDLTSVME